MSTTAQATIKRIYLQELERSDLYKDANSSLWQAEFRALVTRLVQVMGLEAYNAWWDQAFPDDDDIAYTWKEKYQAVEIQLKAAQP